MRDETFLDAGVDWQHRGYFARSFTDESLMSRPELDRLHWLAWRERFAEAKRGDFSRVCELVRSYEIASDWLLAGACADLLGDAGDVACLHTMAGRADLCPDLIVTARMRLDFSTALAASGVLSLVPAILDAYRKICTVRDADIIPYALSEMLEPEPDALCEPGEYASVEEYCASVLTVHAQLALELGPHAVVFRGEPYSVQRLASAVLKEVAEGELDLGLRHRFEASTGIETAQFYEAGRLRPLTAAAIVEGFLASAAAEGYADGHRYFFGHRIP